jgi:RimJ/RimL family protein N-acetyltransferase
VDLAGLRGSTARLRLRPYTLDDLPALHDLTSRPEVVRYLPYDVRDEEACREAIRKAQRLSWSDQDDVVKLAADETSSGRYVGEFVLMLRNPEHRGAEVGYVLHPDAQGRGLATEGTRAMLALAFDVLGVHRVIARIDAANSASAAVLRRLGMRHEAHLVKNEVFKGDWGDEDDYALLEEEWATIPATSDISWTTTAPASDSTPAAVSPPA